MKKWNVIICLLIGGSCFAQSYNVSDNISFVVDFLKKIRGEQKFTVHDERVFLGEIGGIQGHYLRRRLLSSNKKLVFNDEHSISPIGTLLQLKKRYICDKFAVLQGAEVDDMLIRKFGGKKFEKMYGMTYILIIAFERKDTMSLDNRPSVCLFAVCRGGKRPRIDLSHSIVNGVRLPAVLGFIDDDNTYDMKLNDNEWELLVKKLTEKQRAPSLGH